MNILNLQDKNCILNLLKTKSKKRYCYNIDILNIVNPELQLINTKSMIKNKLKELLSDLKKFR